MWNRKEVKEKGKQAFLRNYWKCVLVALIYLFVSGGSPNVSVSTSLPSSFSNALSSVFSKKNFDDYDDYNFDDDRYDDDGYDDLGYDDIGYVNVGYDDVGYYEFDMGDAVRPLKRYASWGDDYDMGDSDFSGSARSAVTVFVIVMIVLIMFVLMLLLMAISFAFKAFVLNPLAVGCDRFFLQNQSEISPLKYLSSGFDKNYKNVVKTMFFKDLYIYLWSLLFIVPGIIKRYEYRLIPYLLAENPDMTKDEAFEISHRLMDGQKWNAFVYDLSFAGWEILAAFTCGILSVFYVNPYKTSADAALYEAIRYGSKKIEEDNVVSNL